MATFLVTGGAGFIGSHLVQALLAGGERVRVLDNFSTGRRENLPADNPRLEVLEGDLRQAPLLQRAVQGVEVIFHLAAFISVPASLRDPQTCFEVNAAGTATLLEAARQAGARKVVFSSSSAIYGDNDHLPLAESETPRPLSPYALSKLVGEQYGRFYTRIFGLPVTALRYFNVYGPRQAPDSPYAAAIPIFIRRLRDGQAVDIFGDGQQTRDFIFVGDVVRANLLAAETPAADGEVINICTGQETSLLDLLAALSEAGGSKPEVRFGPPRPGDIYRSAGDPHKAVRLLGFRAETTLADGLRQTFEWMGA
ncbi:MAG: SDR family oxidoreductase [Anaerolineales bacterium]